MPSTPARHRAPSCGGCLTTARPSRRGSCRRRPRPARPTCRAASDRRSSAMRATPSTTTAGCSRRPRAAWTDSGSRAPTASHDVRDLCEHVFVSYVELHCHSAFSFLDGASLPEELVVTALERGHRALALTDHNTVSGSMEFAQAASSLGLKAIHGAEVDVVDDATAREQRDAALLTDAEAAGRWLRHVTLLVRDATGWRNLCRLLTRAHAHTRESPG